MVDLTLASTGDHPKADDERTVTPLAASIDAAKRPPSFCPPNGPEVNPRDAVRCAAGWAARRLPRLTWPRRERVASGVTPCVSRWSRRLGRRARHPASRRVLPRVGLLAQLRLGGML